MRIETDHIEKYRFVRSMDKLHAPWLSTKECGMNGVFFIDTGMNLNGEPLAYKVIVSDEGGWDHVSVSLPHRTCTWEEICKIKDLFFYPYETVVQYHPAHTDYVNIHPHCLHLWRCQHSEFPVPPIEFV